jgi:hypothetical protein
MNEPSSEPIQFICVGCGYLTQQCKCAQTPDKSYETELAFRQHVKQKLALLDSKLDQILNALEDL